jgi:Lysophospholipase
MTTARFTASDGVRISYMDVGDRNAPAVALVHGLGAAGLQFVSDAMYLAERGRRVLIPDLRGHGASKVASLAGVHFGYQRIARDMAEMLDHAGVERVDWVGNSLGGIAALELLKSDAPRLSSLTLFGTAFRLALPALSSRFIPWLYAFPGPALTAKVTAAATTADPAARALVESMLLDFDPRVGAAIAASVRSYDLRAPAMDYAGPMLVIRGGRDTAVNAALADGVSLLSGRPNFTLVQMPSGGHCANLDDPAFFRDTLERFWAYAPSPAPAP